MPPFARTQNSPFENYTTSKVFSIVVISKLHHNLELQYWPIPGVKRYEDVPDGLFYKRFERNS